jgi:hypothetical protein
VVDHQIISAILQGKVITIYSGEQPAPPGCPGCRSPGRNCFQKKILL